MNEREIFEQAIEIQIPAERQAFLDQACGGDAKLRAQLDQLLASHQMTSQFMNTPLVEQLNPHAQSPMPTIEVSSSNVGVAQQQISQPGEEDDESQPTIDQSFLQPSTAPGSVGRLGHYEILKVLGQGAFGLVFKAFDEKLHRHVAIKVMNPQLAMTSPPRKRFLREARSVAAIKHDNIVQVYSVEEQPLPYLVMEYIDGESLQQKLDGAGPLEVGEILRLGCQMAAGLAAAHEKGLIHRDIKPSNILLERGIEPKVKITDFGLARAADDATVTRTGMIAGTPMFMAPEQALGQTLDHRADLFSLGSVLYQMACGRPPFRGATAMAVLKRVVDETPRPIQDILSEVPDWLCTIIEKLHAKNRDERYATANEVGQVLAYCQTELQRGKTPHVASLGRKPAPDPSSETSSLAPLRLTAAGHGRSRQPLLTATAMAVILLIALGITEATGVTKLAATVIRISTGSGTLVVETDDPGVGLSIDGEELVITGGGVKEIRLKPGEHKLLASKDGQIVTQELVTITRGGRQVVRMSKEAQPAVSNGKGSSNSAPTKSATLKMSYTNSLGMEFVLVPKGKSWLSGYGGTPGDQEVEIKEDFYVGKFEVAQEEWQQLTGLNPSAFKAVAGIDPNEQKRFPVENVSWFDAQDFVKLLNEKMSETGWVYRLPTSVEWEYACRGGPLANRLQSGFDHYFAEPTNTLLPEQANFAGDEKALKRTCKVGSYSPNRLGLCDMHGNVWEWCHDELPPDPKDPQGAAQRLARGGSWENDSSFCRAAYRGVSEPAQRSHLVGLRLVRVPSKTHATPIDPDR